MTTEFELYNVPPEDMNLPALDRPSFRALLNQIRKHRQGHGISVYSPLFLSPTEEGCFAAMRRLRMNHIEVRFGTDPLEEELEVARNDGRIKRMIREIEADGSRVKLHPASWCPQYYQKDISSVIMVDKSVNVYLARSAFLDDAAHELTHRLLELEGFPALQRPPNDQSVRHDADCLDHIYSSICSAILDIEVDRRIAGDGFSPEEATDRHALADIDRLTKKGPLIRPGEPEPLHDGFQGVFRNYTLSGDLKAQYFQALEKHHEVHALAMEAIAIIEKHGGTDQPGKIANVFRDLGTVLRRFSLEPIPFTYDEAGG